MQGTICITYEEIMYVPQGIYYGDELLYKAQKNPDFKSTF